MFSTYWDHIIGWSINKLNSCMHCIYNFFYERVSREQCVLHCSAIKGRRHISFKYNYIITKNGIVELVNKSINVYDTKKSLK